MGVRTRIVITLAAISLVWLVCCGQAPQIGVTARLPGSFGGQLTFAGGLAIEVGIALTGPAIFAARYYLLPWDLGRLSLVPSIGLGGAVAFLPGDLIAWGAYGVAGLELSIPKTKLHLTADLVAVLPLYPGTGSFDIGPQLGLRLDF
jgi:hypothetical protein